jgi:hypothetical protein
MGYSIVASNYDFKKRNYSGGGKSRQLRCRPLATVLRPPLPPLRGSAPMASKMPRPQPSIQHLLPGGWLVSRRQSRLNSHGLGFEIGIAI